MCPAGDDFAFQRAHQVFSAFDDLSGELKKLGKQKGFETEVKYSNLYGYFEDLKSTNLTYGLFKGDFMPYQEIWPGWNWNDYWTGYYSTRLHMKRWIRHTFNNIGNFNKNSINLPFFQFRKSESPCGHQSNPG